MCMVTATQLRTDLLQLAQHVDPETMSPADAVALVKELSVIEKAAAAVRMFVALRVAKSDAWRGQGHGSAADWLAAQAGITVNEAKVQLGTARKAKALGKTEEQMRAGKLSPAQAGAVTDGATADPDAEDRLLDAAANDTTSKLKEEAAKAKAAATDSATRAKRVHAERSRRSRTDAEGAYCSQLRGPAAQGIELEDLIRPYEEQAFRTGRTDGRRDTYENRSWDAFFAMVGALRDGSHPACTRPPAASSGPVDTAPTSTEGVGAAPGDPGATPTARGKPAKVPGGNNVKIIVRIDHTALLRGWTIAGETCEVAGLGPISVTTVQELLRTHDPFLAAVVAKGRDVVNVAHLGRGLNAHQRTAIEALGLRCSNRACNKRIAIQIDHRVGWVDNPETRLDNQDPLCPDCHRKKTHHGWYLEPGTGPRRFLPPEPPGPPPPRAGPDHGGAKSRRSRSSGRRSAPVRIDAGLPFGSD